MSASLLFLLQVTAAAALTCTAVPGQFVQIDASNGQVYGVGQTGDVYTRMGDGWSQLPGKMQHVTVGAAGVWAVGPNQELYRLVEGKWAILAGLLSQIDAGGDQIVVGVDKSGDVFCSNHKAAVSARSFLSPAYAQVPGKLKYYACGPRSCWGVSHSGVVSVRLDITRNHCMGEKWLRVRSRMVLVEVGTDGSVYALNHSGFLYRRLGITRQRPEGTQWKRVDIVGRTFRHVTADLGALWLIEKNNDIVHCQ